MPCTEVSALSDFSVVARGIVLYQPKTFSFWVFMAHALLFRKGKETQQYCLWCGSRIPCWLRVPESCVSSVQCPLFLRICIRPSSRLSARQSCPSLSCSLGIGGQFGLFVIFNNLICPGTEFQQQLFCFMFYLKTFNFESLMFPMISFSW